MLEVTYCVKVFLAWPDVGGVDFEAGKFNSVSPKYKFGADGVENDAIVATDVKPLDSGTACQHCWLHKQFGGFLGSARMEIRL